MRHFSTKGEIHAVIFCLRLSQISTTHISYHFYSLSLAFENNFTSTTTGAMFNWFNSQLELRIRRAQRERYCHQMFSPENSQLHSKPILATFKKKKRKQLH